MARPAQHQPRSPSTEGWFYARRGQEHGPAGRQGPVSLVRLKKLARKGWLTAEDLVWHRDLPDWLPAAELPGLFNRRRLPALLKQADDALGRLAGTRRRRLERARKMRAAEQAASPRPSVSPRKAQPERRVVPPPVPPASPSPPAKLAASGAAVAPTATIETLPLRYLLAGFAGLLALLGMIFMLVEPSLLAWLLLVGGLVLTTAGLLPEILMGLAMTGSLIGRLLVTAVGQWRSAAQRRAVLQQDEALRRAAAKRQGLPESELAASSAAQLHAGTRYRYAHESLGGMVVVREPAIKLWSRPVAGLLSFVLPGLGQCYKGHILGGIVWFCCVSMGYAALIFPGLVLHLLCIAAAASGSNYSQPRTEVIRE
ncbi:MAG: hypothetical protein RLZZ622_1386 [Planctomycetota bacterium]